MSVVTKIVMILSLITTLSMGRGLGFNKLLFKKSLRHMPTSKLSKAIVKFKKSPNLFAFIKAGKLAKVTPVDKITKIAQKVADTSPFANRLMGTKHSLYVIDMYAKHGDNFFKSSQILTSKISKIDTSFLNKIAQKIPSMPKFTKMDNTKVLNRFVSVMKSTGKVGVNITKNIGKIAIENPKSAVAGVLYSWFLADPEGFNEELHKFGGNIREFASHIGGILGDGIMGAATGFVGSFVVSASKYMTPLNIVIFIVLFLLWLVWEFRTLIISFLQKIYTNNTARENNNREAAQVKNKKHKGRF